MSSDRATDETLDDIVITWTEDAVAPSPISNEEPAPVTTATIAAAGWDLVDYLGYVLSSAPPVNQRRR